MNRISRSSPVHTRRQYLRWVGSGGLVGLAGCSGSDAGQTPATEEMPTASKSPTATPIPTKSPSPTAKPAEESCAATEPSIPTSAEEWWPAFRHSLYNDGYNPTTSGPTAEVGIAWQFETGGPVRSSPAVFDESVFVGSNDGRVYALNMVTGESEWTFETGGPVKSSPAVYDGTVYIGSNDRSVYALDPSTGQKQWQFDTDGKVRSSANYVNPDWVDHSVVVIGSNDGSMYLLKGESGQMDYEVGTKGAIVAKPMIVPHNNPNPWGYLAGVGNLVGESVGKYVTRRTVVQGDGSAEEHSGPVFFEFNTPLHTSQAAPADFFTSHEEFFGGDDGVMRKFDDGPNYWNFETDGKLRSSPSVTEDPERVYFGSWDGGVYAVNDSEGKQHWRFETCGKVNSSPAIADGTVYIGSADHHVYGVDAESGEKMWDYRTGGAVHSSPAVVVGTVFVGSDDGYVYALTTCQ